MSAWSKADKEHVEAVLERVRTLFGITREEAEVVLASIEEDLYDLHAGRMRRWQEVKEEIGLSRRAARRERDG